MAKKSKSTSNFRSSAPEEVSAEASAVNQEESADHSGRDMADLTDHDMADLTDHDMADLTDQEIEAELDAQLAMELEPATGSVEDEIYEEALEDDGGVPKGRDAETKNAQDADLAPETFSAKDSADEASSNSESGGNSGTDSGSNSNSSDDSGDGDDSGRAGKKKVQIEFPYSNLIREKVPKVFEVAETVAEEWVNNGNFENVPVGHPLAQITVAAGLRKAKEIEKQLEDKGVFAMAKMGLEYAKSQINDKLKKK